MKEIISAVLREIVLHRFKVVFCFVVISALALLMGWLMPKTYQSHAVIYADESNIIKPLLAGSAQTTSVKNRSRVVRGVIHSRRLMSQIIEGSNLLSGNESPAEIEEMMNSVRSHTDVTGVGSNYIKIEYKADQANKAYRVASTITNTFLKDSADTKRTESREAYLFIDRQVSGYKSQLQAAELALKDFNATNFDGTEASVGSRIDTLRTEIEVIKLDIEGLETRSWSVKEQIASEKKFVDSVYSANIYEQQLRALRSRLASMRLSLTDTHPDIVTLRHQIADQEALAKADTSVPESAKQSAELNPLYQELRGRMADAVVELKAYRSRLKSTERLLEEEYERRKRIASSRAELAELTRDYNVTKAIYEDMLARKEKARLSMTLDIEGQGVTYKIQEPAVYPLTPIGMRFYHLMIAGPLLGFLIPIALIILYVQVDPRIRFASTLTEELEIPVLATIPHVSTPLTKRVMRQDIVLMSFLIFCVVLVYAAAGVVKLMGGFSELGWRPW